jgi:hypothetical protein
MVIHPSYYNACDVSCDVIYYVIAVCARRMDRIFFLPYLGNHSKSDPCSYELFCLESHILSFLKVLQIPPESPCIFSDDKEATDILPERAVIQVLLLRRGDTLSSDIVVCYQRKHNFVFKMEQCDKVVAVVSPDNTRLF